MSHTTDTCDCIGTLRYHQCCGKPKTPDLGLESYFSDFEEGLRARLQLRASHRAECNKRPCERCEIWICALCGGDSEVPRDDRKGSERPSVCERCTWKWDRKVLVTPAVHSIPEYPRKYAVPTKEGREAMSKLPDFARHANRLPMIMGTPTEKDPRPKARNALFCGPPRIGKTMTACFMLRSIIVRGLLRDSPREDIETARDALFMPARDLAAAGKKYPLGKGEPPEVTLALNASFLVLDDLGSEGDNGIQVVKDVIMDRYDRGRITWATTFLPQEPTPECSETFARRYGGGVQGRLTETGTWLDFGVIA